MRMAEVAERELSGGAAPGRGRRWLLPLLLSPALILGCLGADFLPFDDQNDIEENPALADSVPVAAVFLNDQRQKFYYPLTLLSWRLDKALWGIDRWATGVRVGSLLCHVLAAVLLWLALEQLGVRAAARGFAAAAFALHPAACESVAWAVERKDCLAALLGFEALCLYFTKDGSRRALSAVPYACALLAKPSALGLFAVVAVWELLGRPRFGAEREQRDEAGGQGAGRAILGAMWRLLPWALLSAAAIAAFSSGHAGFHRLAEYAGGSLPHAVLTDFVILREYLSHWLWPAGLSAFYYVEPVTSLADWELWLSVAWLAAAVAGTLWLAGKTRRRLVLFGWLWLVAALGPNLNLVPLGDLMHDRYAYLAGPGFWLALALALEGLSERCPALLLGRGWLPAAALAVFAAALAGCAFARSCLYSNAAHLFRDAVEKQPLSSGAHIFLSTAYDRAWRELEQSGGDRKEIDSFQLMAVSEVEKGLACPDIDRYYNPRQVYLQHGLLLYVIAVERRQFGDPGCAGLFSAARRSLEQATQRVPGEPVDQQVEILALRQIGMLERQDGNFVLAAEWFAKALQLAPRSVELHLQRADCFLSEAERLAAAGDAVGAAEACAFAAVDIAAVPAYSPLRGLADEMRQRANKMSPLK